MYHSRIWATNLYRTETSLYVQVRFAGISSPCMKFIRMERVECPACLQRWSPNGQGFDIDDRISTRLSRCGVSIHREPTAISCSAIEQKPEFLSPGPLWNDVCNYRMRSAGERSRIVGLSEFQRTKGSFCRRYLRCDRCCAGGRHLQGLLTGGYR
jgi:hypothetical protein